MIKNAIIVASIFLVTGWAYLQIEPPQPKIAVRAELGYGAYLETGQKIGVIFGGTARSGLFVSNDGGKFVMMDEQGFMAIINEDKITAVFVVPTE